MVYVRHWQQFRDQASKKKAYELLRAAAYLQTATGPDRGNVVADRQRGRRHRGGRWAPDWRAEPPHSTLRDLAAMNASWFFGTNASGEPVYDPATGVTYDGVAADGTINRNSGAESTIHGLLTMLALDAHPRARAAAVGTDTVVSREGLTMVEAEAVRAEASDRGRLTVRSESRTEGSPS